MRPATESLLRSARRGQSRPGRVPTVLVSALTLGFLLGVLPARSQDSREPEPGQLVAEPSVAVSSAPSNLVPVGAALSRGGPLRVAGTADPGTLRETSIEGVPGYSFVLVGPGGETLAVEGAGKLPRGFDVAPVVVVVGEASGGRLRATEVLVPGAAEGADPGRGLKAVLGVNIIVWLGLFAYVLRLGHKLRQLEGG